MSLLQITRWPTPLVFLLAGVCGAGFAFLTVNLFTQAMASRAFIKEYGWVAIEHGALWQVAELTFWGCCSLASWLVFKICEQNLEDRYFHWCAQRRKSSTSEPRGRDRTNK